MTTDRYFHGYLELNARKKNKALEAFIAQKEQEKMLDIMRNDLINALREMDAQQEADETEIAWYYWRETIEDILEVARGTLGRGTPSSDTM